jgi:hypothetical protein
VIARLDAQAAAHPETAAKVAELKAEAAKIIAQYKKASRSTKFVGRMAPSGYRERHCASDWSSVSPLATPRFRLPTGLRPSLCNR